MKCPFNTLLLSFLSYCGIEHLYIVDTCPLSEHIYVYACVFILPVFLIFQPLFLKRETSD